VHTQEAILAPRIKLIFRIAGSHFNRLSSAPASAAICKMKNTEKLEAGKAKRTASKLKVKADAERAAKLATAFAEKERVANRTTEEEVENEKAARAVQAVQRKKDRDRKLA
jgi:hypothetical protein